MAEPAIKHAAQSVPGAFAQQAHAYEVLRRIAERDFNQNGDW